MGTNILDKVRQIKLSIEDDLKKTKELNDLGKQELIVSLNNHIDSISSQINSIIVDTNDSFSNLSSTEKELSTKIENLFNNIETVKSLIPTLPDYSWIDVKLTELEALIAGINYTPQDVRDKLESLEGEERLSVNAIKGLDELLKKYLASNKQTVGFGGIANRDFIKDLDISSQLDGVTTTFSIPAVYNIISVHLSSFPHALRKNVDFTYTSTTITFTSEIDPSVTLATGQTCVLTVVTA